MPPWMKRPIPPAGKKAHIESWLADNQLHTVCESAKCPNKGECFGKGTATFLILGNSCTRNCRFCSVPHGTPAGPDPDEPSRVARAVEKMLLDYVVITSVTRDDLDDGGAGLFARTVTACKEIRPGIRVEVLTPDFMGNTRALDTVFAARPDVFNHNIETVPRLYGAIRPQANYDRSLSVLSYARDAGMKTKSGLMVGLGETVDEVKTVLQECAENGVRFVTIGQYLRPGSAQTGVVEFITPELFDEYRLFGEAQGIETVVSGPFVRSSYRAESLFHGTLER